MTSLWSTPRAGCWHAAASATTRPATSSCCSYWPRLAPPPPSPSRSPSRPAAACWWPSCAPPAGAWTPSTPWPCTGYRDRHGVAGAKSDHADAVVLAGILRTDAAAHRPLPADSELVQAIAVLARAQQDAVWSRQQLANQLRSLLREFFPAALAAFHPKHVGLTAPQARAVLAAAPTPTQAASLTTAQLRRLLRHAGRQRNPRRLDQAAPGQLPRRPATPAPTGRAGHGRAGPGPARPAGGC